MTNPLKEMLSLKTEHDPRVTAGSVAPVPKDAQTIAHEKVLRLECLKQAQAHWGDEPRTDGSVLITAASFAKFVIGE